MLFDDKAWLNDYADYGPFARAAVGVLVAKGDWGWWRGRTHVGLYDALSSAIRKNGIAVWGGDEAVFHTEDWIDCTLAVSLAHAFIDFSRNYDLRLKIDRAVWSWASVGDDANELKAYLASAIPSRRVFFDWPQDRRPRTKTPNRQNGTLVISVPSEGGGGFNAGQIFTDALNSSLPYRVGECRSGESLADVLIVKSIDSLTSGFFSADLVIIASDDQRSLLRYLDSIRASTGAKCIVHVQESSHEQWLEAFASMWARNDIFVDEAAERASKEVSVRGDVLASNETFLMNSRKFLRPRRYFDYEIISEFNINVGRVTEDFDLKYRKIVPYDSPPLLQPIPAPPPMARVLEINVVDSGGKKLSELPSLGGIDLVVTVQPQTPLKSKLPSFPDQKVAWDGDKRVLQIHLLELGKDPVTKELVLPRTGASDPVSFQYLIEVSEAIDLRFMVCDGAQILQTARFQGYPGEKYTAEIETDFTPLEENPRPFGMALLVNDSLGGKPSITAITDNEVTINIFEGSEIETLRKKIRDYLYCINTMPGLPFDETLKKIAEMGSRMLSAMQKNVENWPESITRVQLMTKVNSFFPFEFLYDGDLPENINALICDESKACLLAPRGPARCCSRRATGDVFCPMGFVGLNAVVERHVWDKAEKRPFWLRRCEEFSGRKLLRSLDKIVFAASTKADGFLQDDTLSEDQQVTSTEQVEREFGEKTRVDNWRDWQEAVVSVDKPPSIAVLVPHVEDSTIEIGASQSQYISKLTTGKAIVAIVIGCNTAEGEVAAMSLPNTIMLNSETKVIIAALTEVLGRHANTAAKRLGAKIREASKARDRTTVGDLVTDLRRNFLADGIALGLALISIGDADVVLGGN